VIAEPCWLSKWKLSATQIDFQASGGVLFTGDLNNDFLALDAKTGDVLYRFNTSGSIGGGVISYSLESNMPRRPPARFPPSSVVQARRRSSSSPFPNPPSKSVRRNAYCRLTRVLGEADASAT